ncbi:MAG TPA: bifunctional diaminohydroxyphosphoribosylaminopyrimidine deaminase/5-amino-6-(5-phosphoribosylamino)uracil reductase RibD [Gemmatimonadaceae bacterium]|nr:bifunctional diaminohydroxyphosphoribosylaminopyrimidine deaminase/5-amino-6-(5-phosphoribosylamino)uracil reductase RibD [Gemmatimonadaceae bacterium]
MPDERPDAARDRAFMRRALDLAGRGWGWTAPNPMVGAVVVRDGVVVGEGWHARFGEAHAEVAALRAAGDRARGATVYVTLEPCDHEGKTPPCTRALLEAGVARVVAAVRDPSPVARGGLETLAAGGVAVDAGVLESEARELNAPFFHALATPRPWVTLKLAVSVDGAMADAWGRSRWITGREARAEVHRLRAGHDAVAVGIGTALADDPALTVRDAPPPRVPPRRVVFDRGARLPLDSVLARTALETPVAVVASGPPPARAEALRAAGVEVIDAPTLGEGLVALRAAGVRSLLVEGGPRLAGAILADALADRLIIFQAPVLLGAGALSAFAHLPPAEVGHAERLRVLARERFGDDLMTVYAPARAECSPG